jgi:thiol-disulfide isomerase/thioredoxin
MRLVHPATLLATAALAACGNDVVLSDADGWLPLQYDCSRFESAAFSTAQQAVVRDYASRIVLMAARESRLDSLQSITAAYDSPELLEQAVVRHMCGDGRLASVAELDSFRTPPPRVPGRGKPADSPEADSIYEERGPYAFRRGDLAPTFIAPWLDSAYLAGRPDHVRLADLRGKWVLLNFWATWCGPCIAKHDAFVEMAERYADEGFVVIGVLHRDWPDVALAWLNDHPQGPVYRTIVDADTRISARYGIYGIPRNYLIDPDGYIADNANRFDTLTFVQLVRGPTAER